LPDHPYLRGPKIGPLWLRMLRDNVKIREVTNLDKVPIPVDIHIARATLCLGIVRGRYNGPLAPLYEHVRAAWRESVMGLALKERGMIALDVDEPLWNLSKYGCSRRDKDYGRCPVRESCEAKDLCVPGKVSINGTSVELYT